ncbi:unnamed protein product [Boreogadus saida]
MGVVAVVGEVGRVGEVVLVGEVGEVVVVRKEIVVGEVGAVGQGGGGVGEVVTVFACSTQDVVSQQGPASLPSSLAVGSRTAPVTGAVASCSSHTTHVLTPSSQAYNIWAHVLA